ncbi:MAG: hypothetical protein AAFZ65_09710, partial [Planctomycetota bacterium]
REVARLVVSGGSVIGGKGGMPLVTGQAGGAGGFGVVLDRTSLVSFSGGISGGDGGSGAAVDGVFGGPGGGALSLRGGTSVFDGVGLRGGRGGAGDVPGVGGDALFLGDDAEVTMTGAGAIEGGAGGNGYPFAPGPPGEAGSAIGLLAGTLTDLGGSPAMLLAETAMFEGYGTRLEVFPPDAATLGQPSVYQRFLCIGLPSDPLLIPELDGILDLSLKSVAFCTLDDDTTQWITAPELPPGAPFVELAVQGLFVGPTAAHLSSSRRCFVLDEVYYEPYL